jgi:tRNA (mo5U34)-methyltransferase
MPFSLQLAQNAPSKVDANKLRTKVFSRPWFHRIDLGHGIVTPGVDDSPSKLKLMHIPDDLTGKTLLDIGAYDGFFSFEAERRGASRVLATDKFCWQSSGMGDGVGFKIAHAALGSHVEAKMIAVEDISPATVGLFDVVLFLGVLYHSPDPLRYLRVARSVCKEMLILETHLDALDYARPAMVFYPGATLNNDPTNFWGPNPACVAEMLKEVGFSRLTFFPPWHASRVVVHAFV